MFAAPSGAHRASIAPAGSSAGGSSSGSGCSSVCKDPTCLNTYIANPQLPLTETSKERQRRKSKTPPCIYMYPHIQTHNQLIPINTCIIP